MTHDQFLAAYNGKYVDYDKAFGFQCVDLMRKYVNDVFGLPPYKAIPQTGTAKNIFLNFPRTGNQYFSKIFNAPTNAPQKGDIVFWGTYLFVTGWAGHVGICTDAGTMKLVSFDQNYPTGTPCHYQSHSYRGVMGWLHRK